MRDGESIKERTKRNGRTIEQAHLFHTQTSTEGTYTVTIIKTPKANAPKAGQTQ